MFFAVVVVVLPHHQLDTSTIANEPVAECVSHLNKIDFKQQLMGVLMLEREFVSISGVIVKLPIHISIRISYTFHTHFIHFIHISYTFHTHFIHISIRISGVIVKLPNTQTTHDHAHECFNEIITYLRITGR